MHKERVHDYDQAYVDASPALADVYTDNGWRTVLLSAQGNGGDTVFCLDVTNPHHPTFLWEFSDPDLFRSRSSPSIAKIGRILLDGEAIWVAFFVSGNVERYDRSQYPSVYMIDIETGAVVQRIYLTGGLSEETAGYGGVPSGQPTIIDSDGNGYIDRFYIGTDKGFLYKVNIPDDPEAPQYGISNCVINRDFTDEAGRSVDSDLQYQPIYGSPVAVVDNDINPNGSLDYRVRIFFGTGDSPYAVEDVNAAGTQYHFFAYEDHAEKGVCDANEVSLDWLYELEENHRVFASAFAAAGTIYFGTSTASTEDPCEGGGLVANNQGRIYALDALTGDSKWPNGISPVVGNMVVSPLVVDEHLYVKSQKSSIDEPGVRAYGTGRYNNETIRGGEPQVEVRAWREIF
jgi:Tfp pilus tip-associated adhesin PilY1